MSELAHVKALFQLRAIAAVIRGPHPHAQHNQRETEDGADWLGIGGESFIQHDREHY